MNTFRFQIHKEPSSVKGMVVSNNKIHQGLFNLLSKACHEAVNRFNGKLDWYETYIYFECKGKKYTQVKGTRLCDGCVFWEDDCIHPHFTTKPHCEGKIYKQV